MGYKITKKIFNVPEVIERFGIFLSYIATWLFLFILNPGHKFREVKNQKMYHHSRSAQYRRDLHQIDIEMFYEAGASIFNREVERGKTIDEKNKVLLTIAAIFLAVTTILAPNIQPTWLVLLPQVPILVSVYLVLIHFGVQSVPAPNWKHVKYFKNGNQAKSKMANEYFESANSLSPMNDYRVGVYRASSRAMTIGVLLLIPLFIILVISPSNDHVLIDRVKNDKDLQLLLRGAVGPTGAIGEKGDQGPRGLPGKQGPAGTVILKTIPVSVKPDIQSDAVKKLEKSE